MRMSEKPPWCTDTHTQGMTSPADVKPGAGLNHWLWCNRWLSPIVASSHWLKVSFLHLCNDVDYLQLWKCHCYFQYLLFCYWFFIIFTVILPLMYKSTCLIRNDLGLNISSQPRSSSVNDLFHVWQTADTALNAPPLTGWNLSNLQCSGLETTSPFP